MSDAAQSFDEWLRALEQRASRARWRYLVWLSGDRAWGLATCMGSALLGDPGALWLADQCPTGARRVGAGEAAALLGTECDRLVVDAWSGLHPNAFGALAGTVRAGGVLVLISPSPGAWPGFADPDYRRLEVPGFEPVGERLFLAHLARSLGADAGVLALVPGSPLPPLPQPLPATVAQEEWQCGPCLGRDQARAVAAIAHVVSGHRDRPLVLCADRGRGKTSALGIAAAALLREGAVEEILVTAPRLAGVEPLFERAEAGLPGALRRRGELRWRGRSLVFLPPDELLRRLPPGRLLLVDEAAAIPAPLLSRMLDGYHRIVFTTTVHGYEGTGRGFAVRFQRELSRRRPHWQYQTMGEPVRWAGGDPLEDSVRRLLWLQAEAPQDHRLAGLRRESCQLAWLDRGALLEEPVLMQQLVGLLTLAHYRTTPDDGRLLLDAPNLRVGLLRYGAEVVGALLVALEGPVPVELVPDILAGRRRPRGHLLPQTLWAQAGSDDLLARAGARVVRIAVHPAAQRLGLGHRMLGWMEQWALARGLSYVGASFGASPELLPFWFGARYRPACMGLRRDAASGEYALLVLKPLGDALAGLIQGECARLGEVLPQQLAAELRELEVPVALALLAQLPPVRALGERDRRDVEAFASGARSFEHCRLGLRRAALAVLLGGEGEQTPWSCLLVRRLLQGLSWAETAAAGGGGKRQLLAALRAGFARWLASAPADSQR